jgi:hypothetical protein
MPIPKNEVPKGVTPSGEMGFSNVEFKPIHLLDKNICSDSIAAGVSADSKLLFAAYSYDDWKVRICYSRLESNGIPTKLNSLREGYPMSSIPCLGCSSQLNNGPYKLTFISRYFKPDQDDDSLGIEGLYCLPLSQSNAKMSFDPKIFTRLSTRPYGGLQIKKRGLPYMNLVVGSHLCWLRNENVLFYGGTIGVCRFEMKGDTTSASVDYVYELGKYEETTFNGVKGRENRGKMLCSNIREDDDGVLWFVEAPFVEHPARKPGSGDVRAFSVDEGTLVSMDKNGKVLGKRPFPSVPYGQKALLGKTHWCFTALGNHQAVIMAPIEQPKEFIFCRLPEEQLENNGIPLHFRILTHLPDSRYILCSRQVDAPRLSDAEKRGVPLCELGVIELPLPIA